MHNILLFIAMMSIGLFTIRLIGGLIFGHEALNTVFDYIIQIVEIIALIYLLTIIKF